MATVAHEGNPRTNSLVVSGTLDGDVFLLPSPLVPTGPTAPIVEPAPTELWTPSSNSATKYAFVDFRYGVDGEDSASLVQQSVSKEVSTDTFAAHNGTVIEFSQQNNIPMYGLVRSPPIRTNLKVVDVDQSDLEIFFVNFENEDFLGMIGKEWNDRYKKPPNAQSYSTVAMHARAFVSTGAVGFPFSGVAVGVHPASVYDNFTGVVAAYDWAAEKEYLMTYKNQPLSTFGTILGSADRDPIAIDGNIAVRISYLMSTGVYTFLSSNITVGSLSESDFPYFGPDMRAGLINLPPTATSGVDDLIIWKQVSSTIFIS